MIAVFAFVGLAFLLASFFTWSQPKALGFTGKSDEWQTLRGILLGLWALLLPAYSLWEWYYLPRPDNLQAYAYEHKVWSDVWTTVAVLLGVLFGVKK